MGAFAFPVIGRRPIRRRVLVLYRLDPGVAARLIPPGMRPRLSHGHAVGAACYTQLGTLRSQIFHHQRTNSEHLAYRIAVELEERDGERSGTWVVRRKTSSLLGGRLGHAILRTAYGRSRFEVSADAFGLELSVVNEGGEELYLKAEASGASSGALFPTAHEVEAFLDASGTVKPGDVFAPEVDFIDASDAFAPEPLTVFELRSRFFGNVNRFPPGTALVDSVWRLVSKRHETSAERSTAQLKQMLDGGDSAVPAL